MLSSIPKLPSISKLRPLAALALLSLLAACGDQATSATPKAERPVQIQRVAFEPADASREFVGVVRARHETDLGFRVAGKIMTRIVNVGDRVHAGDVVAQLDPQDLDLHVESAQAELAAATSNLTDAAAEEARYANLKTRGAPSTLPPISALMRSSRSTSTA
jgi:multidrug efflux pump subunit AcrA (membrane-fusion protein)